MSEVEVTYKGTKTKMGVMLPVGIKNKSAMTGSVIFLKDQPQKMIKSEAQKLCALDQSFSMKAEKPKAAAKPAAPVAEEDAIDAKVKAKLGG